MAVHIASAPCCWGVDDPKNPHLPPWRRVLSEASQAGYKGIELGPYGYIPHDVETVKQELDKNNLSIIAGTIFDNLVDPDNLQNLKKQVDDICRLVTALPQPRQEHGQHYATPYLVIIDWGHDERDYAAGHPDRAPRLQPDAWKRMIQHIDELARQAWDGYGVRSVVHPHAGGYIEFADEIDAVAADIPYSRCGLCLDTGHLYYSKMDPLKWLEKYADALDYIHFKDIDQKIYDEVMTERIRFFEACAKGVMCPIGQGVVPYARIRELLEKIGYNGHIAIEQERDPRNADGSLEDVKKSLAYLRSQGYAE